MDKKVMEYMDALNKCTNMNNLGGSCFENCMYRENGCCELVKNEIITTFLNELNKQNEKAKQSRCMIGDRGTIYLSEAMRKTLNIKSGDFLNIETIKVIN